MEKKRSYPEFHRSQLLLPIHFCLSFLYFRLSFLKDLPVLRCERRACFFLECDKIGPYSKRKPELKITCVIYRIEFSRRQKVKKSSVRIPYRLCITKSGWSDHRTFSSIEIVKVNRSQNSAFDMLYATHLPSGEKEKSSILSKLLRAIFVIFSFRGLSGKDHTCCLILQSFSPLVKLSIVQQFQYQHS